MSASIRQSTLLASFCLWKIVTSSSVMFCELLLRPETLQNCLELEKSVMYVEQVLNFYTWSLVGDNFVVTVSHGELPPLPTVAEAAFCSATVLFGPRPKLATLPPPPCSLPHTPTVYSLCPLFPFPTSIDQILPSKLPQNELLANIAPAEREQLHLFH